MKKLEELTYNEYTTLKNMGMLWEFYPDAPDQFHLIKKPKKILVNRIQTPDGTILTSRHVHDYQTHIDKNGLEYMVDGGLEYLRRTVHGNAPYIELSVYDTDPFVIIRQQYERGTRGKDGKEPLHWIALCNMEDDHLKACIQYNEEHGWGKELATELYRKELEYRKELPPYYGCEKHDSLCPDGHCTCKENKVMCGNVDMTHHTKSFIKDPRTFIPKTTNFCEKHDGIIRHSDKKCTCNNKKEGENMKILESIGHKYELKNQETEEVQTLQFIHKEPVYNGKDPNPIEFKTVTDGTTNEDVLKVLIHRLKYLNNKMQCLENEQALLKLEEALMWLNKRTDDRKERNVEGTNKP